MCDPTCAAYTPSAVLARQNEYSDDLIIVQSGTALVTAVVPVPAPTKDTYGRELPKHAAGHPPSKRTKGAFHQGVVHNQRRMSAHTITDPRLANVTVQLSDGALWLSTAGQDAPQVLKGKVGSDRPTVAAPLTYPSQPL